VPKQQTCVLLGYLLAFFTITAYASTETEAQFLAELDDKVYVGPNDKPLLPAPQLPNHSPAPITDCDRLAGSPGDPGLPPGVAGIDGDDIDYERAMVACRKALDTYPNEPRFMYELGRALPVKDDTEASLLFRRAAEAGYARAMTDIADRTRGTKNWLEKVRLYRQAADLGDPDAMNSLADSYLFGLYGLTKNECEAARLYREAGKLGNFVSAWALGRLYENGQCVIQDQNQAARLYLKAVEIADTANISKDSFRAMKHSNALTALGRFYEDSRGGLSKDDAKAALLYRRAIDICSAAHEAMFRLGRMYESGRGGVGKNDGEAARLFGNAVDLPEAKNALGVMYSQGRGVEGNDKEAVRLFQDAAKDGNALAMYNVGVMYENGRGGLPKDLNIAKQWYQCAADNGEERAKNALEDIAKKEQRVAERERACKQFRKTCAYMRRSAENFCKGLLVNYPQEAYSPGERGQQLIHCKQSQLPPILKCDKDADAICYSE
jgi:TPR repeat protein